jgi:hypothetical protein
MALIFNSVTQFEIQPERTKKRVKRDDLDTLTEVWTGPSALEDSFVPVIGTAHPDFSMMTVISTAIKRLPMYVSEVTIEYHGKLDNYGAAQYTSVPTISQYWAEGEVSLGSGGTTISRRYSGRCVQIGYLTNRRPSGNPSNIGAAQEFLGFTNVWDQVTSFGPSSVIIADPIKKLSCTDVKVDDKADGWYRVTETYQSRMYPGESISGVTTPTPPAEHQGPIAVTNWFVQPFGDTGLFQLDPNAKQGQNQQTKGGAQAMATAQGQTLATRTVASTPAADTAQQTAIDPGSFLQDTTTGTPATAAPETSPILAASSAGYSWDELASATINSAPLEY